MPNYSIQAPNGKTYRISGPEGASQEDVQAEVMRQFPEASGEAAGPTMIETNPPEGPPPQQTGLQQLMDVLKPAKDYAMGAREMKGNREWFSGSGGKDRLASQLTPSLPTTLGLTMPGVGLVPSLARMGATGAAGAGEAALEGKSPLAGGLVTGGIQGAAEALPYVARPAARIAGDFMPGATARAIRHQNKLLENLRPQAGPPEGGAWGKFAPTGVPAGNVLGPNGQPATQAIPAEVVPHPSRPGWTMIDEILSSPAKATPPSTGPSLTQGLMRLLGAGAQEGYERGGM